MDEKTKRTTRALRALAKWARKNDAVWNVVDEDEWDSADDLSNVLNRLADGLEKGYIHQ